MPGTKQDRQGRRSFIEEARRRQLVDAAIEVIGEAGLARASLKQIAQKAGTSRGLISYHFAGRDDLIGAVVARIFADEAEFMRPRLVAAATPGELLHAYLLGNLEYMRDHRGHVLALVEIATNGTQVELRPGRDGLDGGVNGLESILRAGQESGDFRQFDPRVMAVAIRSVIDAIPHQMAADPELDVDACTREIVTMFALATRRPAAS